ncbi:MAG: histidinol-phosphate transaminase [Salinivirgaceae bacterium]|nr:histidinol-phosphate transaminase [Salinivirgaceae bacterium]
MNKFDLNKLIRPNVLEMLPYSSARDEFEGEASVFLDANENSLGSSIEGEYNRYPDPRQTPLRNEFAKLKGIKPEQIFFGNGSDEAIDLLFRAFCEPKKDRALIFPPTYGMYKVQANINETPVDEINLNPDFTLPIDKIEQVINPNVKLMFICSPNNPTGNLIAKDKIIRIIENFRGLVIVDEAYIDFAPSDASMISEIENYPNLVVLQTFSKAWGLAGLRLGMAFAQKELIDTLCKIKYPYNVNQLTQDAVLQAVLNPTLKNEMVATILEQRTQLIAALNIIDAVKYIYPTDANFVLAQIKNATEIYKKLIAKGIVVRNRSNVALCNDCLRITIGTAAENKALINELTVLTK